MTFSTILEVTEILCSFKLVLEVKTGKEIPKSSRLEYLEKFSANNFALSDAKDNISGPLNRGSIADSPLLKTLLAIRQKSREPSFWEIMDSFVSLAYASLAASRNVLQRLLACLNFTLVKITSLSEIYFRIRRLILLVQTKEVIYELWQQHKKLKTMEMNKT